MNPDQKSKSILTLDVEDWEHANFFQLAGKELEIKNSVKSLNYKMDSNIEIWINTLHEYDVKSTCFVLGEFAQRFPHVVKKLFQAGHEISSHGYTHDLIYTMSQSQFREYLKKGLGILGDLLGIQPMGFRAPSWSVNEKTPWFCDELAAQKIIYDSSLFPMKTPLYGHGAVGLKPFWEGGVFRVPATLFEIGALRIPFASGAFFRIMPLPLIQFGLKRALRKNLPSMVVLHPRELDPQHPRLPLQGWESVVHYWNLSSTLPKLHTLLGQMSWGSIHQIYADSLRGKNEL